MTGDGGMLDAGEPRGTGKHFVVPEGRRSADRPGPPDQLEELATSLRLGRAEPGVAYLVGAGPGDPGLLGVRAARLIATADVILHDLLIAREVLELARVDAELYDVGKVGDGRHVAQEDTNALMVRLATQGRSVVRLKGGDPFVFGRGGEELAELLAAGVRAEVVPGITAGTGALAAAGIPATHRSHSSAVAFVTGHGSGDKPAGSEDWESLAHFPGTLVFYMAVKALPKVVERLLQYGRPADQPAAVVERGTTDRQRTTRAPLAELPAVAAAAGVRAPALIVVGDVAGLGDTLDWRARRPLDGKRIVVTRAGTHAGELAGLLRADGADVLELPAIRTVPTGLPLPDLGGADLICVTSPAAAEALVGALADSGRDVRALAGATLAAIGPGTAAALARHGLRVDLLPQRAVSEGLVEAIAEAGHRPRRAIVVQARSGREVLAEALRAAGTEVELAHLHEAQSVQFSAGQLNAIRDADAVLFASGSAARSVAAALTSSGADAGAVLAQVPCVAIGPITAQALEAIGAPPAAVADPHTLPGLVAATLRLLA